MQEFTTDATKEKKQIFSTKYQNYSPLKATSTDFKEISNTWYAARDGKWIYFNRFDDKPGFYKIKIDGTGMVPVRFVAENFGYEVKWEPATKMVIIR